MIRTTREEKIGNQVENWHRCQRDRDGNQPKPVNPQRPRRQNKRGKRDGLYDQTAGNIAERSLLTFDENVRTRNIAPVVARTDPIVAITEGDMLGESEKADLHLVGRN